MISMTGFGRAENTCDGTTVSVEIAAVNSRKQRDVRVVFPRELGPLEPQIKQKVQDTIQRGTATVTVSYTLSSELRAQCVDIDTEVAAHVAKKLRDLAQAAGLDLSLTVADLLQVPGVLVESAASPVRAVEKPLTQALADALKALRTSQAAEGNRLKQDLSERIGLMHNMVTAIDERKDQAFIHHRNRLLERIALLDVEVDVDDERLAKEVAFCAEKSDVTEEVVRLQSHLAQFGELLDVDDRDVGRELDFLCQEMNREATTIGSKAAETEISELSISLKAELARIREQVMNVE